MKKRMAIILCSLLAATGVLAGCAGNDGQTVSNVSSETGTESQVESAGDKGGLEQEMNAKMTVGTQEYKKEKGSITINYAMVDNMDDSNLQNTANTLIQQDMLAMLSSYEKANQAYEGTLTSQVVYNDGKVLSVLYTGTLSAPEAAYPVNVVYTSNIDLQTGQRYETNVIDDAEVIAGILVSGQGYEIMDGDQELKDAVIKSFTLSDKNDLIKKLSASDLGLEEGKAPVCFSYQLDEDHVVVYLPVGHALGDVAGVKITL